MGRAAHLQRRRLRILVVVCICASAAARSAVAAPATAMDTPAAPSAFLAPPVSDPMLAPPPEATRRIASWEEALDLIRSQSPDYTSSAEGVVRAEAQKRVALAAVLPVLTGQASYVHQFSTVNITLPTAPPFPLGNLPAPDVFTVGATLGWSVINPRGLYGIGTANRNIELEALSFADRRKVIAQSVVDAMLATLAAVHVAELNRVGLRAALERLTLTQTRLQYGQGTALDVDRAEQDVEASRALIISGDEALRRAREALGVALGSPEAIAPPGDLELDRFEVAVAKTCRLNDEVERRPDIRAARLRVEVAERGVRDAELLLAPSLALSSTASYATQATLGPNTLWSVQGVLTVPFYDGGARYGLVRDARAAVEQARAALLSARLAAVVNSEQAYRAVGVLESSRDVARQQRDLARRVDTRTRDGYAHGLGTSLDLVTSAQALRQAEINLALLEFQVAQAHADAVLTNAECAY